MTTYRIKKLKRPHNNGFSGATGMQGLEGGEVTYLNGETTPQGI
jgi:hypothetical protein